eukprot:8759076-Pyramimonas_sp.AAC.1
MAMASMRLRRDAAQTGAPQSSVAEVPLHGGGEEEAEEEAEKEEEEEEEEEEKGPDEEEDEGAVGNASV